MFEDRDEYGVRSAEQELFDFLAPLMRLTNDERVKLEDLLSTYVQSHASERGQDAVDRKFNEGVYRD